MRVTERQQVESILTTIRRLRSDLFDRNEQIVSGKRVNRPSDDPLAMERITQFQTVIQTTKRRLFNVNEAIGRLNLSDSTLETAGLTLQRAKELAVQMRNDTNSATERLNAAKEVQQLILGMVGIANTQLNGRFIFAGSQTQTEPYVLGTATGTADPGNTGGATISASVATASLLQPDLYQIQFSSPTQFDVVNLTINQTVSSGNTYSSGGSFSFDGLDVTITNGGTAPQTGDQLFVRVGYVYQGDGAPVSVEIGDGRSVASNLTGSQVFSGPTTDLFQNLQDFHQALARNDMQGIEAAIGAFDQALSQVTDARADLGARVNRLDTIKEGFDLLTVNTETFQSEFEDTDFAKAASELASLQTTLEASMATLTRQFDISLLNYLR